MSEPTHPAVDWTQTERRGYRLMVQVTCPWCHEVRFCDGPDTRRRIRQEVFTGFCYKDRLIQKPRADRLPRMPHPAVNWTDTKLVIDGHQRVTRVATTCLGCGVKRYVQTGALAAKIRAGRYSGLCLSCSPNARVREWAILGPGRKLDPVKGYVRLGLEAIQPEEHWLWHAMKGSTTFVFEHRFVMARALNRPLASNELVDHMDGVKTNNDLANLRLYRRGRNEPGETTGYGTYYHEWQLALARIRELEVS
jgi:hypothetical protein